MAPKVVIDTNIIVSALKSQHGAANKLLSMIGDKKYISCISVPLVLEYEEVVRKLFPRMKKSSIDDLLNYICKVGQHTEIHYLWRPILADPDDDMVLEVAVSSQSKYIITYNEKDFKKAALFGISVATPKMLLSKIGALP